MAIATGKALLIVFFLMHVAGYGVSARLAVGRSEQSSQLGLFEEH